MSGNLKKMIKKVTVGFVVQDLGIAPDGKWRCTGQEFVAEDGCTYEDQFGNILDFDNSDEVYESLEMKQPGTDFYALIIEGDVEPELIGPFETEEERDSAAQRHRDNDPEKRDGIYPIQVPKGTPISIDTFCDQNKYWR